MAPSAAVATRYASTLERLADRSQGAMVRLFNRLPSYDETGADRFHALARPLTIQIATAATKATSTYLYTVNGQPAPPSELVISDAAARCFDPFDRLARNLSNGMPWAEAITGARSQAAALGDDAVFRTARSQVTYMGVDMRDWQRRLSSQCCQWCMKLAGVVFDSSADAMFGHAYCRCLPVPVDAVGDHNTRIRDEAGFDAKAEDLYDQRAARRRLRDSANNAQRRSDEAAAEALIEPDPKRRDRLETRAQEWETRAEAANERLRILETGTHLLPA